MSPSAVTLLDGYAIPSAETTRYDELDLPDDCRELLVIWEMTGAAVGNLTTGWRPHYLGDETRMNVNGLERVQTEVFNATAARVQKQKTIDVFGLKKISIRSGNASGSNQTLWVWAFMN